MSTSDHSPYKSRLFNLLNRQSLRWRDRLIQTARHFKVAAEWSIQILVYPIYLTVQTGRTLPQKIGRTVKRIALPSQTTDIASDLATVDRPLERVLEKAEYCLEATEPELEEKLQKTTKITNFAVKLKQKIQESFSDPSAIINQLEAENDDQNLPILVQGMANNLENHQLILIAQNNTPLPILSEKQQHYLNAQIRLETASYWYDIKQAKTKKNHQLIPVFSSDKSHVLPPIRWFWRAMRWVQTGQVAIALNLFNESSMVRSLTILPQTPDQNSSITIQKPEKITTWENTDLKKVSPNLGQLKQSIQQTINNFVEQTSKKELLPLLKNYSQPLQQWKGKLQEKAHKSLHSDDSDPFRLQMLIYAAIDYFFGKQFEIPQIESAPTKLSLKEIESSTPTYLQIPDPWLSQEDFLGETLSVKNSQLSSPVLLPQATKLSRPFKKSVKKRSQKSSKRHKNSQALNKYQATQKINKSVVKIDANSRTVEKSHPNSSSEINSISPDWIETKAESTGYVKHPLERVLEWLDLAIHWLEKLGTKLWQWFKKIV